MPLPLLPILIGLAGTALGAVGIKKAKSGLNKRKDAKHTFDKAISKHEKAQSKLDQKREETNDLGVQYGEKQLEIIESVVNRLILFMNKYHIKFSSSERKIFEEIGVKVESNNSSGPEIKRIDLAKSALSSASAASAGFYGVSSAVVSIGTASTGTAISGLSGAAATNATLAYLGGGSIAAGGGGMLLGKIVLGGISIGAAVFVGGLALDSAGEKLQTEAKKAESEINIACAKIKSIISFLKGVDTRVLELSQVADEIKIKALKSLKKLENINFDKNNVEHVRKFQEAMLLVTSLINIINTPILDAKGNVTTDSGEIVEKYRAA